MFEQVTQRRRRLSPGVIVAAIIVAGLAAGVLWLKSKADHRAALESRFQTYEAAIEAEERSLVNTPLPGMSLQLPGQAVVIGDDQEGEATATVAKEVARVRWKRGEPRSEADFGEYVRFVAGSFIATGLVLTTGCEQPEQILLGDRPALRCERSLISSMSASGDRYVPPSVVIMTGTCGGRVVDLIVTSSLIAARMQSTFRCTSAPAAGSAR